VSALALSAASADAQQTGVYFGFGIGSETVSGLDQYLSDYHAKQSAPAVIAGYRRVAGK